MLEVTLQRVEKEAIFRSLFPIPYSLFPIPYSLFPIPYGDLVGFFCSMGREVEPVGFLGLKGLLEPLGQSFLKLGLRF